MASYLITIAEALDAPAGGVQLRSTSVSFKRLGDVVRSVEGVSYHVEPAPLTARVVNGVGSIRLEAGYYMVTPGWSRQDEDQSPYAVEVTADALFHTMTRLSLESLDPTSEETVAAWADRPTRTEVDAAFVRFQKVDGTPLTAKHVVITVADDGSIADILAVS